MKDFAIADLFCGAGGTSEGAVEAIRALGFEQLERTVEELSSANK